jgi:hypothetical protein
MPEDILATAERPHPLNLRCPRCRSNHEHPTVHISWYRNGSIAQWWKCGCGAHNTTRLDIEPIVL